MKTFAKWLVASLLLASAIVRGAPFEGRVLLHRTETGGASSDIICSLKGDNIRTEVIRERVNTFITNTAKQETTVILEDDMAYLVLPSLAGSSEVPKLEKTEETTKILGYPAQKYTFTSDEGVTELWLAEGMGKYTGFGEGFEPPPIQEANVDVVEPPGPWLWEYALAGQPLFPLRVITRDSGGTEIFRLEAKAITPEKLNDRLFQPSSNYKKLDAWPERRA